MNPIFEEFTTNDGQRIGVATLAAEASLNALNLPMLQALSGQFAEWATDPNIVCVVLRGAGSKAFCAGGDVRSIVAACRAEPGKVPAAAAHFFAEEYRFDYTLHRFPKPLMCWGHGYVMGGGMGLLQGANIRIVTPSSRLAMPEISIGLFPDVGASWFLSRLPGKLGLFLALTGAQINAQDALDLGLADRILGDEQFPDLLAGLRQLNWHEQSALQLNSLLKSLERQAAPLRPESQWLPLRDLIDAQLDVTDIASAWRAIGQWTTHANPQLSRAATTLQQGCPLTAQLIWAQLSRAKYKSLAEVLQMEYTIALNCCRHPEFSEGVRARLLDKDHTPRWHWPEVDDIDAKVVDAHFLSCWDGEHPLADLQR